MKPVTCLWAACALAACGGAPRPSAPPADPANDLAAAPLPIEPLPDTPLPGETGDRAQPLLRQFQLSTGLNVALLRPRSDGTQSAEIGLWFPAGTAHGKQGACDLAADLLVHGADLTAGRQSLSRRIELLGGTLTVEPGRLSTWFAIRVRADRWRPALQALAETLQAPPPSRSLLERAHTELLQRRSDELLRAPLAASTARLLLGDRGGADHLESIQDRDPSEGVVFASRWFRPEKAIVAVRAAVDPDTGESAVRGDLGSWAGAEVAADPQTAPGDRGLGSGIFWAPEPGADPDAPAAACRAGLVFGLPDPLRTDAAKLLLLLNCVTMEGVGGRLERLLLDAGLADLRLQPVFVHCGDATALLLWTTTTPDRAAQLYALAQNARRSLQQLPPTDSERALARGRAWLGLRRADADTATALRAEVLRLAQGIDEDRLQERLADLEQPDAVTSAAVTSLLELPLALVVVGGAPPEGTAEVQPFELVPNGLLQPAQPLQADSRVDAALPWLDAAVRAVGGADRLRRVRGLEAALTVSTDNAPDVDETFTWTRDGTLHRERTVLGAVVETDIQQGKWTERSGNDKVQLSPVEASWRLSEAERHPLALLAAHVAGQLRFRMLATKRIGDRDHVLLEAITDRFERLRVQLDRESGLIRIVEAWTMAPEGTPTRAVDTWSDYRTVDGVRLPFRRVTVIDDGQSRRVADYTMVQPLR